MRVAFYVSSGQKGVVLSTAKEMSMIDGCEVCIIARDNNIFNLSRELLPDLPKRDIINLSKIKEKIEIKGSIFDRALRMEGILGEYCSMLSSYDRGIGQGYLGNADRHPHIMRSFYSHKEKLIKLLEDFECFEILVQKCDAKFFFGWQRPFMLSLILKSKEVDYITYSHSRIGNKFMLVKDEMLQSDCLINSVNKEVNSFNLDLMDNNVKYTPTETFTIGMSSTTYSMLYAIKNSIYKCVHEVYKFFRKTKKIDSYVFCGWIPVLFRKVVAKRYWDKYGVKVTDIKNMRTVIFPLHMEPEVSLLQVSPEFNNSYEVICWVSKSLPADTMLVVKENPWSFGIRSIGYYDRLRKIGNVELAHPSTNTKDWIDLSIFTVAITGTSGFESVYYHKPVLSYGKYQIINHLPTVRYVESFSETKKAIKEFLNFKDKDRSFIKSEFALNNAILNCSFSLPNMAKYHKSDTLVDELGKILCRELYEKYIYKLSSNNHQNK